MKCISASFGFLLITSILAGCSMNSSSDKNDNSTTVNQNSLAIQNFPIGLQKYYLDQIVEGSTEKRE
jgi:hypothetical protein